jgi:hypothetical protein
LISSGIPEAKAAHWGFSDAEERKPGERTGLDTPVVLAVNDEHWAGGLHSFRGYAKNLILVLTWFGTLVKARGARKGALPQVLHGCRQLVS